MVTDVMVRVGKVLSPAMAAAVLLLLTRKMKLDIESLYWSNLNLFYELYERHSESNAFY